MKKRLSLLLVLLLAFSLVACQTGEGPASDDAVVSEEGTELVEATDNGDGDDAVETPATEGDETYTIGLNFELTGATADYGVAESKGAKLAIAQKNEEAGYEKYKIVEYDNKSDAAESVTIGNMLASDDEIVGVVGPATSGASVATYQILDDAGKVLISPSATQNNITLKNPDDPNSDVYDHVFRVCFEDNYQGKAMAQHAKEDLGFEKMVVYSDSASDYAKGLESAFIETFENFGGEIVGQEYYVAGDTDFSSVLTNINSMDFDAIYIAGYYNEIGLIIKQAREMGIDSIILGGDGMDSESLANIAGAENLNDVKYTTAYTTVDASQELKDFIGAFEEEYNEQPAMFAALAYDSTMLLIQAIEESEGDMGQLRDNVRNIEFSGITGDFTFDDTHSPIKDVLVVELVDGEQAGVEGIEVVE